jgi:hypothetical protein
MATGTMATVLVVTRLAGTFTFTCRSTFTDEPVRCGPGSPLSRPPILSPELVRLLLMFQGSLLCPCLLESKQYEI